MSIKICSRCYSHPVMKLDNHEYDICSFCFDLLMRCLDAFLLDDDDLTSEEIDKALIAFGYDPQELSERFRRVALDYINRENRDEHL